MAAWAFILHEGHVLFIKRSRQTSRAQQWCLPGGGLKTGETHEMACIREMQEEVGLAIVVDSLIFQAGDDAYFMCQLRDPFPKIQLKHNECEQFAWVEPTQLMSLGMIMDFKKISKVLFNLGIKIENMSPLESL